MKFQYYLAIIILLFHLLSQIENIVLNVNQYQEKMLQKLPLAPTPVPSNGLRRKWQNANQQTILNNNSQKVHHIRSPPFIQNIASNPIQKIKQKKIKTQQKPLLRFPVTQNLNLNKYPYYGQVSSLIHKHKDTTEKLNSAHIQQPPVNIKIIKQIGEKGPIRTIPAPNLSLLDKPTHYFKSNNKNLEKNEIDSKNLIATKTESLNVPQHQYQVFEDETMAPVPLPPVPIGMIHSPTTKHQPVLVVPDFQNQKIPFIQVPIQFEKSFYNVINKPNINKKHQLQQQQQAYASISFVEPTNVQQTLDLSANHLYGLQAQGSEHRPIVIHVDNNMNNSMQLTNSNHDNYNNIITSIDNQSNDQYQNMTSTFENQYDNDSDNISENDDKNTDEYYYVNEEIVTSTLNSVKYGLKIKN